MLKSRNFFTSLVSIFILSLGTWLPQTATAQNGSKPFSIEEITNWHFAYKHAGRGFRSMDDGRYYTELNYERTRITQSEFATGREVRVLFDLAQQTDAPIKHIDDYIIAPGGNHMLLMTETEQIYRHSSRSKVYHYDVRRNRLSPLSSKEGLIMIPTFSPDGRMVAFVRDNNIFIHKFDFDSEIQVTTDGKKNEIIYGATDWVYEEELGSTKLLSWSADNNYLAYVRFDESAVKAYDMPLYGKRLYPVNYTYKYPKAGEKNSDVSLFVYNINQKVARQVVLPVDKETYLPRIEFTPIKNGLAVFTLNRHQNDFKLFMVNPATLVAQQALRDTDEAYIKTEWVRSLIISQQGFTMVSEKDGYAHIYQYSPIGEKKAQLTKGAYDVLTLYGADKQGNIYYQAADVKATQRRILKVTPSGKIQVLAGKSGINDATFSSDFTHFLNVFSNTETPHQYSIHSSKDGKQLRMLEENQDLAKRIKEYRFAPKEFIQLEIGGGITLNGWMQKPKDFDPNKQYPLLMVQYSGPDSQEVLDRFSMGWEYYLAQEGYLVACVDGRGTGSRGREWRKCTYMQLGILESDDQIAAAKAFGKLPFVDASRIGIWGWSFGGYMTLLTMCRGEGVFKAGISVAPVTDWRYYDTIYTERYLRTPQENPDGYTKGAPLHMAKNLKGNLLIVHGGADDNVHLQNAMDFVEVLVQHDIPFEMAIYTDKDHSIYGGNTRQHLYKKKIDFLKKNL